ncbi:tetratricopeptide repeat protein (macronuclear) [Tetrahymena thermophila SB210]|uniref:Tetratricopeptide repeat protein n=1 Tax=Tetrahymena thermophila (strain SB210) TaxID=312017 RepID=Q22RY2_TETTS|nr:tetratricopeptide repeat protein [Tetrahymena thermophila SB210]EAR87990.1 tetratricopeptide repeat protein [Tetrahymena thermophila SB210]|eukprot:XP_001008235.1 tetratricopeptide repeat protein [Tetrahymena thermophila SB210]
MSLEFREIHVFYAQKQVITFNDQIDLVKNRVENQLKAQPKDIKLLLVMAQIYHLYYNNYKLALNLIKKVLQIDPKNVDARLDLVDIMKYHSVGESSGKQTLLEECLELDKYYWRIYFIQLKVYDSMKLSNLFLLSKAIEYLEMFPNNFWLKTYYLQIDTDMSQQNKIQDLTYLKESEYLDFEMLRRLAYITKNQQEKDFSILCEEYSIRLNPNSFYSLNNLAYSIAKYKDNQQKSIEYYKKALEQNPNYFTTLKNLVITYEDIKDYTNSLQYLKRILRQNKKSEFAYRMMIGNSFKDQEFKIGLFFAKKSVELFPNQFDLLISYLDLIVRSSGYQIYDYEEFEIVSFQAMKYKTKNVSENDLDFICQNLIYIYSQNNLIDDFW